MDRIGLERPKLSEEVSHHMEATDLGGPCAARDLLPFGRHLTERCRARPFAARATLSRSGMIGLFLRTGFACHAAERAGAAARARLKDVAPRPAPALRDDTNDRRKGGAGRKRTA